MEKETLMVKILKYIKYNCEAKGNLKIYLFSKNGEMKNRSKKWQKSVDSRSYRSVPDSCFSLVLASPQPDSRHAVVVTSITLPFRNVLGALCSGGMATIGQGLK